MKKLGAFCLTLGILMALGAGIWHFFNEREELRAGAEAQEALALLEAAVEGSANRGARSEARTPAEMATLTIDGYTYIGTLSIPEIHLELPVQSDWSEKLLKKSPGRYRGSVGEGNLIIAGHNYKKHFTPLKRVSVGGRVVFTDVDGNAYQYVVSKILTVGGYDTEAMLADSEHWDLTLFTCTYGGEDRLTLRCSLESGGR